MSDMVKKQTSTIGWSVTDSNGKKKTSTGANFLVGMGNGKVSLVPEYDVMSGATMKELVERHFLPALFLSWPSVNPTSGWNVNQDNDKSQNAMMVQGAFRRKRISVIPGFPANSGDLHCIENLWPPVQDTLRLEDPGPETREAFVKRVQKTLRKVPSATVRGLIRSMPNRISECIANSGGRVNY